MAVYAIITKRPDLDAANAVEEQYPNRCRRFADNVTLVHTQDDVRIISAKIGVKTRDPEGNAVGRVGDVLITQLSPSYWGFADTDLWTWLQTGHQSTV